MRITLKPQFLILLIICFQSAIHAQSGQEVIIKRLEGEIIFDGIPDEAAWQTCQPFPMVTHLPVFGKEPTERTDIRILFDAEYIYVGASMYTSDPSTIMSTSKKRDEFKEDCDWLGVIFDSYKDNENGLAFWTTPDGLRTDIAVYNDAQGGGRRPPINTSWNTHWDVKSTRNQEGWFSEILIPVSSLRFQETNGEVTMGLSLIRKIPNSNETYVFPAIPNDYGDFSAWKPSLSQNVVFPELKSKKPLYITPYVAAGFNQQNNLNAAETDYEQSREFKPNAGLDLKYGLTSNLTMDLTVNTDFAQVEADDERVNLTRFNLFFQEKRQFFLERSSVFDFNVSGSNTMFYSRRIGLDNDGNIVPIIGGARLIGRKGDMDIGFLNMQTMKSDNLPSENFGVLRIKKRIINDNSYVGGIYTSRIGLDGSYNQALGLDLSVRVTGDEYMKIVYVQTFENGLENKPFSIDNTRFVFNWTRRRNVGFYYSGWMSVAGIDYNPGIGFQNRHNYWNPGIRLAYRWQAKESSPILRHGPQLSYNDRFTIGTSKRQDLSNRLQYAIEFKNNMQINITQTNNYDYLEEDFNLSDDALIPAGKYTYSQIASTIATPTTRAAAISITGSGGQFYDGKIISTTLTPTWSISSSLMLSGDYIYSHVKLPLRNQEFISHIARVKALVMFTTKLSISAFIQYNSKAEKIGSNIRFRYNPREGNDLWLVYNENTNTNLERELPHKPSLSARTIMLKYTYTFSL